MTVSNQPEQPTHPADPEVDAAVSAEAPEAAPAETGVDPADSPVPGADEPAAEAAADQVAPDTEAEAEQVASSEGAEPVVAATEDVAEETLPDAGDDAALAGDAPTAAASTSTDAAEHTMPGTAPERPEPAAAEPATPEAAEPESQDDAVAPPAPAGSEIPPEPEETPAPAPSPAKPSPAAMPKPPAGRPAAPSAPAAPAPAAPSNSTSFGRVAEDGTVYVRTPDGEKPVGSYPGASADDALAYFARKYDEMWAAAELLYHRVLQTGLSAKEAGEDLGKLREHIGEANVVGDLPELDAKVESIATAIEARKQVEATERAAAREQAKTEREAIVAEAERIAAQDPAKTQWKSSGARIRELLDEWKQHQRSSAKLDRETENAMWQRFSAARNSFDKGRRVFFAELESTQSEAKATKERLVAEAEKLASSTEWGSTAGAFKRLMDQWRKAGRAGRKDDDALWARFKAAQDSFFNAKDEVAAEEDKEFRANLEVKEGLLTEAKALLPVKDLQATKAQLRTIQDKWDAAGKVPRSEMGRVEGELRKVEQAVRDAEDAKWKKSNPEVNHRASAFAEQIERALEKETKALDRAKATGDERKIKAAEESLASRRQLLEQVMKLQG